VQQLKGQRVFGSGFGAYTRDYPQFEVFTDYTIIYDSSHIDPNNTISSSAHTL